MHTPTKAQLQKVIDLMYTILPLTFERRDSLDMSESRVDCNDHVCGTVHCFAGWFAVACMNAKILSPHISYTDGGDAMARMLGFNNRYQLRNFTKWNAVWGNHGGWQLFTDRMSFYHPIRRPKGAKSVSDIINHLEEVQARLPK